MLALARFVADLGCDVGVLALLFLAVDGGGVLEAGVLACLPLFEVDDEGVDFGVVAFLALFVDGGVSNGVGVVLDGVDIVVVDVVVVVVVVVVGAAAC